jgi:hypothetical protein
VSVRVYIGFGPTDHGVKSGELALVQASKDGEMENKCYKEMAHLMATECNTKPSVTGVPMQLLVQMLTKHNVA